MCVCGGELIEKVGEGKIRSSQSEIMEMPEKEGRVS